VCTAVNIIYVDVDGPNDPGSGTSADPFRRIQDAINAASAGDIIEIRPGTYTSTGNYNLDPSGKNITIRSIDPNDPEVTANTIIDPNGAGRGFHIHSGEDTNCVISGLTIKNAYIYGNEGAGIYCSESDPTIANCTLTNNYAEIGYGGAICCKDSNSLINNCVINGNSAYDGGGVECWDGSSLRIINCIISNNRAMWNGGGVDCYYQCALELTNCSFIKNIAEPNESSKGGSISLLSSSSANIKNSILWSNDANAGAQLYLVKSTASLSYCDIQGGISDVCYLDSNVIWGDGNIDIDPCFVSFEPNIAPNLWDLHLQSKYGRWESDTRSWVTDSNTSPCVDAGDPNSDWTAEPWPNGKRINIGAYGGTHQASKNGNPADFDVNGIVNPFDLMEFSSKWLDEQGGIVNLDLTGCVDFHDFAIFAENWLWQRK
jgi:hypothetical protein